MSFAMDYATKNYPWHKNSWDYFVKARSRNHLPHALLLTGENGIGKLDFAKKMVKSLLCIEPLDNEPCHQCKACKTYESGANPDFMEIRLLEDKQQISVDQIRKLSEFLTYSRSFNSYRVVLINPVERMNLNAANSLLKSLEEPASNTIIILLATQLNSLLPTIKSRCQLLSVPTPDKTQALAWLRQVAPEISNADELLAMANGKPLLAVDIQDDEIRNREQLAEDILHIVSEYKPVTEIAKKWEKHDHDTLLNWQISWVQDFIKQSALTSSGRYPDDQGIGGNMQSLSKTLFELRKHQSTAQQWQLYQQLITQKQYLHTSVNSLMFIENMLLLWSESSQI